MNRKLIVLLILVCVGLGCSKKDDPIVYIGGKGGNGILKITPRHHGAQIDSCTVYIKYNSVDAPSDAKYDDSAVCVLAGGIPVATISGLKRGNYYLYGYGWDPSLSPPAHVKGGLPYVLNDETSQTVALAVSED